ncbi:MAG TPA: hypothetical protein VIL48_18015 [Acidimicrobiales bacterium]
MDDLGPELERWAAEARVDDAARQRTHERWLRQQAEEEATLVGVLCDLAERGTPVAVRTRVGRQHRGTVAAVGEDFVAVAATASGSGPGPFAYVALAAVASVRTSPGRVPPPTGDRVVRSRGRLADVLAGLAAERERILVVTAGAGDAVAGSLRAVGRDVAVVRLDGAEAGTAYVPLEAVAEVVVGG